MRVTRRVFPRLPHRLLTLCPPALGQLAALTYTSHLVPRRLAAERGALRLPPGLASLFKKFAPFSSWARACVSCVRAAVADGGNAVEQDRAF